MIQPRSTPDALLGTLLVLASTAGLALIVLGGNIGAVIGGAVLLGDLVAVWTVPVRRPEPAPPAECGICDGHGWTGRHGASLARCGACGGTGVTPAAPSPQGVAW